MNRILLLAIGVSALAAVRAETFAGQWIVDNPRESGGKTTVQFTMHRSHERGESTNSNSIALSELRGLSPALLKAGGGGAPARFELVRAAGSIMCEGFFQNGRGAGSFDFRPNPGFPGEMRSLGYGDLKEQQIFAMAAHDVGPEYARELRAAGVENVAADKLIAMRIHGVTADYIQELRSLGYTIQAADKLVAMRIHGVSAQVVRDLKSLGYDSLEADKLIAMRIHGASPEFIREIAAAGFAKVPANQLISMRIHGVTADYIRKMQSKGLAGSIDKLVQMRIHGID